MLKRTKKGFTLAELLIVVAIIAVLTAIAVPLFVTSLDKAEKAVFQANRDAVRSAGVATILAQGESSTFDITTIAAGQAVKVTGTFDGDKLTSVAIDKTFVDSDDIEKTETKYSDWKSAKGTIIVCLTATDLAQVGA